MTASSTVILSQTRGNVVCEQTEVADKPLLRLRGLLGRDSLAEGHGMLITPAPSIHSAFMGFEFDAVFLSKEMQVVKTSERIPPWRVRSAKGARSVLELASGEVERRGVEVGDVLVMQPSEQSETASGEPADG